MTVKDKPANRIAELREQGYEVDVNHVRKMSLDMSRRDGVPTNYVIEPRGGATTVTLTKGEKSVYGHAICSDRDNYNRKIGLAIALGRACKELEHG
jgi:hypothetical protein